MLRLDWCSRAATEWACAHWHYSGTTPPEPSLKLGVWEGGRFAGAIVLGRGANHHLSRVLGVGSGEAWELTRVALGAHITPVSRLLAIALRMVRRVAPWLRVVASYADTRHGHHGGIYQAAGWSYLYSTTAGRTIVLHGRAMHARSVSQRYGHARLGLLRLTVDSRARFLDLCAKHCYAKALDPALEPMLRDRAMPYPKPVDAAPVDAVSSEHAPDA